jgi:hypothetical protein
MAERLGVKIRNYHADNERLADNAFVQHAKTKGKGLNQRPPRLARKMMIHVNTKWPKAIDTAIWT